MTCSTWLFAVYSVEDFTTQWYGDYNIIRILYQWNVIGFWALLNWHSCGEESLLWNVFGKHDLSLAKLDYHAWKVSETDIVDWKWLKFVVWAWTCLKWLKIIYSQSCQRCPCLHILQIQRFDMWYRSRKHIFFHRCYPFFWRHTLILCQTNHHHFSAANNPNFLTI